MGCIRRPDVFFIETIFWVFEEAVPLVLDAPALLSKGDLATYIDTLQRLLPLFIRLQKKNYVVAVSYILSAIPELERSPTTYQVRIHSVHYVNLSRVQTNPF